MRALLRSLVAVPVTILLAACGSTPTNPAADDDSTVDTETTAEALSVTSTPGEAVWTKVWRATSGSGATLASDVANDSTGSYLLRTFTVSAGSGSAPTMLGRRMDVTRYSPTGALELRADLPEDLSNLDPGSTHIAAGDGRVIVTANQLYSPDSVGTYARWGHVVVMSSSGEVLQHIRLAAMNTRWTDATGQESETTGLATVSSVAVDGHGGFVVVGVVDGDADLGAGIMRDTDPGRYDAFIARYDRDGNLAFVRRYEGATTRSVGLDQSGAIYVGGTSLEDAAPTSLGTVTKLSPTGSVQRTFQLASDEYADVARIAVARDGSVAFGGGYHKTVTIGDRSFTETNPSKFGETYLGKLAPDGSVMYARTLPGAGNRLLEGLAIDSYGQMVFAITIRGELTVGSTHYETTGYEWSTVLGKVTASSGLFRWSKGYRATAASTDAAAVRTSGLAIGSSDRILMTGSFTEDVDFGKGVIQGSPQGTGFLTRFYQ